MLQCIELTTVGIEEVNGGITKGFTQESTASVHISVLDSIDSLVCIPAWRLSMLVFSWSLRLWLVGSPCKFTIEMRTTNPTANLKCNC